MCNEPTCAVHFRNDEEKVEEVMGMEFISKISYHGEWAIFTDDNNFLPVLMVMGKPNLPHMTLLIKVGSGSIGDVIDSGGESLKGCVYDGYFSATVESARERHEMIAYGLESGILNPTESVTPFEIVTRY